MQRFFVSGFNKSGTTFVQMLLNAHPCIHCPSEHYFSAIYRMLDKFSADYKSALQWFDQTTARQGIQFREAEFKTNIFRAIIHELMRYGASEETTHVGLNDNSIIESADLLADTLPHSRFVFIVRDPRDVGISLWHHRMRHEPAFVQSNIPLRKVVLAVARAWSDHVEKLLRFQKSQPKRVKIVRYEDLIDTQRSLILKGILDFLSVSYSPETIDDMWSATDFEKLQSKDKQSNDGGNRFFRSGKARSWQQDLSHEENRSVIESSANTLRRFNYSVD